MKILLILDQDEGIAPNDPAALIGWVETTKPNTIITLKVYIHMGKGFNSSSVKASFNHPMLTGTSYNLPAPKRFHI